MAEASVFQDQAPGAAQMVARILCTTGGKKQHRSNEVDVNDR
jgi:hypothetical protein